MSATVAQRQEAARLHLARLLHRLGETAQQLGTDLDDGAPLTVELRDRLEVRLENVSRALDNLKAIRP